MTPTRNRFGVFLALAFAAGFLGTAHATNGRLANFNTTYGTTGKALDACSTCHTASIPALNPYGTAVRGANDNFRAIDNVDSDGDGFTNIQEIMALTFPGDPNSHPAVTPPPVDMTSPMVTSFTIPPASASLTIPITSLVATDDVGVTGYLVTQSSSAPSASAAGWTTFPPASFVVSASGSITLWAWAKDAAGNVSAGVSATLDVTDTGGGGGPDTVPPVITNFQLPTTSSSRTINITSFTASDNVRVTGYQVTASSRKPRANSSRWKSQAPTSFTFRGNVEGQVTLRAWTKDAAGNISEPATASTIIQSSGRGNGDDDGEVEGSGGGSDDGGIENPDDDPGGSEDNGAISDGTGTDLASQMGIWVSRWFNVSIQNPTLSGTSTPGYLKIQSWNEDDGIMQATLFTQNGSTGAWQSVDLEINVTGSPMRFLASFAHAGEFSFSASVIGTGDASNLQGASLQAVGVSQSQHLAVMNGHSANGPITITGTLLSEREVPRQILH